MSDCRFLFLLGLVSLASISGAEMERPNIVLLLADDLGINDLSGFREAQELQPERPPTSLTPHIDALAEEGLRCHQFYAGNAVCSPSRAALLTGRNAARLGIYNWIPHRGNPMHLRTEETTIAEMLKPLGYHTGHFGKWHLSSGGMDHPSPNDQGFDTAFYTFNNANPSHENPDNFILDGRPLGPLSGYSCHLVVDQAIRWLDGLSDRDAPFFLNVWFHEPHEKVAAPRQLTAKHPYRQYYYGSIENMDLAIGRLLDHLENKGRAQNTIVIFSSDNGSQVAGSNHLLRGAKALNYEGGLRVPLIVRWSGVVPPGSETEFPGSFTDILPTLASLTGASLPAGRVLDGIDLRPVWTSQQPGKVREKPIFRLRYFHEPIAMFRQGSYVLLGYGSDPLPYQENYDIRAIANLQPGPDEQPWAMWGFQPAHQDYLRSLEVRAVELYDLATDPQQRYDQAPRQPDRTASMRSEMERLMEEMIREGGEWY